MKIMKKGGVAEKRCKYRMMVSSYVGVKVV